MTFINSKFAISLRAKIDQNKNLVMRKKRIINCLEKVNQEILTVKNIINQITEDEDIYEKYKHLKNFCVKFDKLWNKSDDIYDNNVDIVDIVDNNDNNDDNYYDINDDPLNTAICEDYF
jgi:hypothetical protein